MLLKVNQDYPLMIIHQVWTHKMFNQAVRRNIDRFPDNFRFQLTKEEYDDLRSQIVTSNGSGGRRYRPYMFTEQGIAMLSGILRSDIANFNAQYPNLIVKRTQVFHDRFIILDGSKVYHIGASIKDAGKKCFGISMILDHGIVTDLLTRLQSV